MIKRFGENLLEVTCDKLNQDEAIAYGQNELLRIRRDSGFSIDLQVIGNPEYFIARWCKVEIASYGIDRYMYITKFSSPIYVDSEFITSITLVDYPPNIGKEKTEEESTSEYDETTT